MTPWTLPKGAIARFGRGSVRDMAFSPDGRYFAIASAIGLWLYELPTLSPIALWDTERGMTDTVTFSPDSRRIVSSTFVENVKVWEVQSGAGIVAMSGLDNQNICPLFFHKTDNVLFLRITASKTGRFTFGTHTQGRKSGKQKYNTLMMSTLSAFPQI